MGTQVVACEAGPDGYSMQCAAESGINHLSIGRMKMNAKQLIAAVVVFAAAGTAVAGDNTAYVDFGNVKSTKTRAEVRAELEKAYADGQLGNKEYVEFTHVASTRSRDEVRKEAVQAAKIEHTRSVYFGG
jgi:hypothetical protein